MVKEIHGFKVFRPDWSCEPAVGFRQYSCPGRFQQEGDLTVCENGIHFCLKLSDCFSYYAFNPENKVAEVIAHGEVIQEGGKCCTNDLEIVREITWDEVLKIVNEGKNCTGFCNTGNRNTGCWNLSSFNTGCFMTEEQPIMMFNKPTTMTYRDWMNSDARHLLNRIPKNVTEWIYACDMTDQEKTDHPEYQITGGYLKTLDESDEAQTWWDNLHQDHRGIILALPNFDADIFFKCTGINVKGDHA